MISSISVPCKNFLYLRGHIKVFLAAAAKVGGINAKNTFTAYFIYENLLMHANFIKVAS